MSVSRRKFLRSSAALSAALVLKPGTFILGQDSMQSKRAPDFHGKTGVDSGQFQSYSRAMFEPHVGDIFRVRAGKQTVDLKLVALNDLNPRSAGITTGRTNRTDCFSLRFRASTPLPTTATIHTLNHSMMGSFDLFMIQSEKGNQFLHTAIVNQVV